MARLQRDYDAGYPESQATFLWWLGDNYTANLGPQRSEDRRFKGPRASPCGQEYESFVRPQC
jgi:hypothetical protein